MDADRVEYAIAAAAVEGERDCGDRYTVVPTSNQTLVAVVDGLGHGGEAASAARKAISALKQNPEAPIPSLLQLCHAAIQDTRGAVMSVAVFDHTADTLSCVCVGNVEASLFRRARPGAYEAMLIRAGVVGYQLPPVQPLTVPIGVGDTLILSTDGIRGGFQSDVQLAAPLQHIADSICAEFRKSNDDALVLVARYQAPGNHHSNGEAGA